MTNKIKNECLRDVGLSKRKQSSFIVAVPRDERDARNFSSLEKLLWVIDQKNAIYTRTPDKCHRLWLGSIAVAKL
jgi:hypothetical protein